MDYNDFLFNLITYEIISFQNKILRSSLTDEILFENYFLYVYIEKQYKRTMHTRKGGTLENEILFVTVRLGYTELVMVYHPKGRS